MTTNSELKSLARADWTLLVIEAANPKTLTPIQLQKSLFLLGQKLPGIVNPNFYEFVPYNYGPFSKDVYADAEKLRDAGMVEEISKEGQNWPEYTISTSGFEHAEMLKRKIPQSAIEYMEKLVNWVESQSFQGLLHAVYRAYPDFAKNSVFNG